MIESHFTQVNGFNVQYDTAGAGGSPVLLLLHGWASSSKMWHETMEALAGEFRCVAPDLPGFGESDKPPAGWYTIANYVAFVRNFYAALSIERAHVVGHSMGGMIALALAAELPEAVDRLVAVNPVVTGQAWGNLGRLAQSPVRWPLLKLARALWPFTRHPVVARLVVDRLLVGPGFSRRRNELSRTTADSALGGIRAVIARNLAPLLPRIIAPAMVMVGVKDSSVPPSEGRLAVSRIPGAVLHAFGGGHLPSDEEPGEFEAALRQFLLEPAPVLVPALQRLSADVADGRR